MHVVQDRNKAMRFNLHPVTRVSQVLPLLDASVEALAPALLPFYKFSKEVG